MTAFSSQYNLNMSDMIKHYPVSMSCVHLWPREWQRLASVSNGARVWMWQIELWTLRKRELDNGAPLLTNTGNLQSRDQSCISSPSCNIDQAFRDMLYLGYKLVNVGCLMHPTFAVVRHIAIRSQISPRQQPIQLPLGYSQNWGSWKHDNCSHCSYSKEPQILYKPKRKRFMSAFLSMIA